MKKIIDIFFLGIIILIILGGALRPIINPTDVNVLENRSAYVIPTFSIKAFLDKSYQDNYEKAYSDQIPLANRMKSINNTIDISLKIKILKLISDSNYLKIGNYYLYNDYLVSKYADLTKYTEKLDAKIDNFNNISKSLTKQELYIYYIDRDVDVNFETSEKIHAYEYINDRISNKYHIREFLINNFDDYTNNYFKTDHHWNYKGSYRAYKDLIDFLFDSKEKSLVEPKKEVCLSSIINGSRGRDLGNIFYFNEHFCGYDYDLDNKQITINDKIVDYYGNYKNIINKEPNKVSYADWYGNDYALVTIDNDDKNKDNILIIGDSFDNAIIELLATHFNKIYSVDLRYYSKKYNKEFNIADFTKDNKIDKVLFIGTIGSFFAANDFLIERF